MMCEVEHDVRDAQVIKVGGKVGAVYLKADNHWCRCLIWIVKVIPRVSESMSEAESRAGVNLRIPCLNQLLPVFVAVQSGVVDRDQHIRDRLVIEEVRRFKHAKLPGGIDADSFEWQKHLRLRIEFEYSGSVERRSQRR